MAFKFVVFVSLMAVATGALIPTQQLSYASPITKVLAPNEQLDTYPRYSYAYDVHDTITDDTKSQQETRDGDVVQGSYSVVDPDGIKRTVEYTSDSQNGFNAVVHREPIVQVANGALIAKVAAAPISIPATPVLPVASTYLAAPQYAAAKNYVAAPQYAAAQNYVAAAQYAAAQNYVAAPQYAAAQNYVAAPQYATAQNYVAAAHYGSAQNYLAAPQYVAAPTNVDARQYAAAPRYITAAAPYSTVPAYAATPAVHATPIAKITTPINYSPHI